MSNKSYALLNNSTDDKLDVAIPVNESTSTTTNTNGDSLKTRYTQIATAVALYWYEKIFIVLIILFFRV